MPFPMKIQPLDSQAYRDSIPSDLAKPLLKTRLKRLFDRQFQSVLRVSSTEKPNINETQQGKDGGGSEFEPSSVCLAKMVQNFIEESNDKQSAAKCGRNRCNCFNRNGYDSSDDESDFSIGLGDSNPATSSAESVDMLKSFIPCASVAERNLLADTSKIVEKNKICKRKDDLRKIVRDSLLVIGYDASICKSRWEKSPAYPAGEYEFIDVIVEGERLLIDIDFKSEFEIARSTGNYKAILQHLPNIFVGKSDRLQQIVSVTAEAARLSLKKKGMPVPPWRKAEYMRAKWLSPCTRTTPQLDKCQIEECGIKAETETEQNPTKTESDCGEFELIFGESIISPSPSPEKVAGEDEKRATPVSTWKLPAVKPRSSERGAKVVVAGLASLLKEKL